ncbi:phosphatase [Campylobacter fetus]|uniref:Ppx/GppA phosphatase family protein n=1 Tax=Campylobacter fetus TaxID=196 RepID=UPI00073ADBF1|nr:phosphatase [Campylobacter fetus]ALV65013.1 exopolyphosphatase, Ppx/GppA family [Campylobacter fetus subsp. testudinum Sp3]
MICIDLGSNTIRVCAMDDNLEITQSYEKIVGSARNLSDEGLSTAAKMRITEALREITIIFDFKNDKYIAVATEAFRLAPNAKDFFYDVERDFGIKFSIISGNLEAKLARFGVENRALKLGFHIDESLLIDLGGASTEISFANEFKSFKFGIVRFCEECCSDETKFKIAAKDKVQDTLSFISKFSFKNIILTSGVPTSVAALKFGLKYEDYDAKIVNGAILDLEDFDSALIKISSSTDKDSLVGKGRASLVIAGIYLLKPILEKFSVPFIVIDDGLREGIAVASKLGLLNLKE